MVVDDTTLQFPSVYTHSKGQRLTHCTPHTPGEFRVKTPSDQRLVLEVVKTLMPRIFRFIRCRHNNPTSSRSLVPAHPQSSSTVGPLTYYATNSQNAHRWFTLDDYTAVRWFRVLTPLLHEVSFPSSFQLLDTSPAATCPVEKASFGDTSSESSCFQPLRICYTCPWSISQLSRHPNILSPVSVSAKPLSPSLPSQQYPLPSFLCTRPNTPTLSPYRLK